MIVLNNDQQDKLVEQCITEGHDYRDCVDTLVSNMGSNNDSELTHDSEGC